MSFVSTMLLAALVKVALLHLSVEQVLGASFSNDEVAMHDQELSELLYTARYNNTKSFLHSAPSKSVQPHEGL